MPIYWEDLSEEEKEIHRARVAEQLENIHRRSYPADAWWGSVKHGERVRVLGPSGRFPPYNQTSGGFPTVDDVKGAWQLLAEFVDREPDERGKRTAIAMAYSIADEPGGTPWLIPLPRRRKPGGFFPTNPTSSCHKCGKPRYRRNADADVRSLERSDDPQDEARYLRSRMRKGEISWENVLIAAYLGDPTALIVTDGKVWDDSSVPLWMTFHAPARGGGPRLRGRVGWSKGESRGIEMALRFAPIPETLLVRCTIDFAAHSLIFWRELFPGDTRLLEVMLLIERCFQDPSIENIDAIRAAYLDLGDISGRQAAAGATTWAITALGGSPLNYADDAPDTGTCASEGANAASYAANDRNAELIWQAQRIINYLLDQPQPPMLLEGGFTSYRFNPISEGRLLGSMMLSIWDTGDENEALAARNTAIRMLNNAEATDLDEIQRVFLKARDRSSSQSNALSKLRNLWDAVENSAFAKVTFNSLFGVGSPPPPRSKSTPPPKPKSSARPRKKAPRKKTAASSSARPSSASPSSGRRTRRRTTTCQMDGCDVTSYGKPLCRQHYYEAVGRAYIVICTFTGCSAESFGKPLCRVHYYAGRNRRRGRRPMY